MIVLLFLTEGGLVPGFRHAPPSVALLPSSPGVRRGPCPLARLDSASVSAPQGVPGVVALRDGRRYGLLEFVAPPVVVAFAW